MAKRKKLDTSIARFTPGTVFIHTDFPQAFIVDKIHDIEKVSNEHDRKLVKAEYKVNYLVSRYPDDKESILMWEHELIKLLTLERIKKLE